MPRIYTLWTTIIVQSFGVHRRSNQTFTAIWADSKKSTIFREVTKSQEKIAFTKDSPECKPCMGIRILTSCPNRLTARSRIHNFRPLWGNEKTNCGLWSPKRRVKDAESRLFLPSTRSLEVLVQVRASCNNIFRIRYLLTDLNLIYEFM